MSGMAQKSVKIRKQQIQWGRADMDEQRECIQGPTGGHWRDVVCNLCDFHGLVYVHGDGDDE